jgi:hypothetical protein
MDLEAQITANVIQAEADPDPSPIPIFKFDSSVKFESDQVEVGMKGMPLEEGKKVQAPCPSAMQNIMATIKRLIPTYISYRLRSWLGEVQAQPGRNIGNPVVPAQPLAGNGNGSGSSAQVQPRRQGIDIVALLATSSKSKGKGRKRN